MPLIIYFFVAPLSKWGVFVRLDPIESDATTPCSRCGPYVFDYTFGLRWGLWPSVVFVAVGVVLGLAGGLITGECWNVVLAGWV